jgi:hypothetical protein
LRFAQQVPEQACLFVGLVLLVLEVKAPFAYGRLMNTVGEPALGRGDFLYEFGVVLDEGVELMGCVLVAAGIWHAALAAQIVSSKTPETALDLGVCRGAERGGLHSLPAAHGQAGPGAGGSTD